MFRSLHMKLVVILVILIISVMAVTGTFVINSVTSYQMNNFRTEAAEVFTTEFIESLSRNAAGDNGAERIKEMIFAFSGLLGINSNRDFFILDGRTGGYICGSDDEQGAELNKTPNIIAAMNGRVGDRIGFTESYMDIAIPIEAEDGNNSGFIVCVKDNKRQMSDLNWMLFSITAQAMLFGLVVAVFLSFFLSKTMTNPIENLTNEAERIADGDFSGGQITVYSNDEIGDLTGTFNRMAQVLKQTIEKAENESNKLNTIFLHMADGVVAFTKDGRLLHMNPAAERMMGIKFSEDLKFSEIFRGVNVPDGEGEAGRDFVESNYEKNDRLLKIFFASFGINESENGLMAVIHDITEESRLEAARREFVANVSHELRTPLTNIKSYTETLESDWEAIPVYTRQNFLNVISNESDRMTRIVSDLLTLSRLDYGKLEFKTERFAIDKLLENVYNAMMITARNAGCVFDIKLAENLPEITADRERIEQVVVNVLSNAVKYTPKGGRVLLFAEKRGQNVVIQVMDTGIGIPERDLPRLFERFYRVDKARSRAMGGTGLGLSIAKEIIQAHNGSIHIESKQEKGTTVTITLPCGGADAAEADVV